MTTQANTNLDRESWLTELADFILDDKIRPISPPIDREFRISVGFAPRQRANSKTIAMCCKSSASATGHNEMFVSPTLDDSLQIAGAVAHELIHFADDCESGHKNYFATTARKIGLIGKLTQTTAGPELADYLTGLIDILGPIPHSKLDITVAKPKQATRMIKVDCPECEFSYRTSAKNILLITDFLCPACNAVDMAPELPTT